MEFRSEFYSATKRQEIDDGFESGLRSLVVGIMLTQECPADVFSSGRFSRGRFSRGRSEIVLTPIALIKVSL